MFFFPKKTCCSKFWRTCYLEHLNKIRFRNKCKLCGIKVFFFYFVLRRKKTREKNWRKKLGKKHLLFFPKLFSINFFPWLFCLTFFPNFFPWLVFPIFFPFLFLPHFSFPKFSFPNFFIPYFFSQFCLHNYVNLEKTRRFCFWVQRFS